MQTFQYIITDPVGIHARPAGLLVKEAKQYQSNVSILFKDKKVDAKKIFGVMGLGAKCGDTVLFEIEGTDEIIALQKLKAFLETNW